MLPMLVGFLPLIWWFMLMTISEVIILALFFARGAGTPDLTRNIMIGYYVGLLGVLALTVEVFRETQSLPLPAWTVSSPYFGLIPLCIGLTAAWKAWRGRKQGLEGNRKVAIATVAAVTFANSSRNIGVYMPLLVIIFVGFALPFAIVGVLVAQLIHVAVLVWLAKFIATRPRISAALQQTQYILYPMGMVALGINIVVGGVASL
ncbi:cadmium resistance transporter [uncultured Tessaracoccus sp.]|uniref:cadmium resistance transporter n=1 Tax=uncultured Tessaracoccus sp. TaxID=905023 RepID=UPI0026133F6B|nr:cadmium resistance transporter [uncultured Tessaracoccus sp.]